MHQQRGFLAGGYLYVVAAIAFVGLLLTCGLLYYRGNAASEAAKSARAERDGYKAALATSEEARAKEYQRAEELSRVAKAYEDDKTTLEARHKADLANARSGALRLRVANACPGRGPETSTAPGVSDGGTTAELPREVTEDLLSLANDADQVVNQLSACQATVRSYLQ